MKESRLELFSPAREQLLALAWELLQRELVEPPVELERRLEPARE